MTVTMKVELGGSKRGTRLIVATVGEERKGGGESKVSLSTATGALSKDGGRRQRVAGRHYRGAARATQASITHHIHPTSQSKENTSWIRGRLLVRLQRCRPSRIASPPRQRLRSATTPPCRQGGDSDVACKLAGWAASHHGIGDSHRKVAAEDQHELGATHTIRHESAVSPSPANRRRIHRSV